MRNEMRIFDWIAVVFLIFGALIWAVLGIFDLNLMYKMFGMGWVSRIMFGIIGIASLYSVWCLYQSGRK
jgi:uncharacterized membrane protein YuzA (DUF378 family)